MILRPLRAIFATPFLRRISFHARRIGGQMGADFRLPPDDDAVVVAQGLGELRPLQLQHE